MAYLTRHGSTILVNNVGKSHEIPTDFVETPEKEIHDILQININSTLNVTSIVLPGLIARYVDNLFPVIWLSSLAVNEVSFSTLAHSLVPSRRRCSQRTPAQKHSFPPGPRPWPRRWNQKVSPCGS